MLALLTLWGLGRDSSDALDHGVDSAVRDRATLTKLAMLLDEGEAAPTGEPEPDKTAATKAEAQPESAGKNAEKETVSRATSLASAIQSYRLLSTTFEEIRGLRPPPALVEGDRYRNRADSVVLAGDLGFLVRAQRHAQRAP